MNHLKIIAAALVICTSLTGHVQAQDAKPPIEITADQSLEWDRGNETFYARGKAIATQGDTSIAADTLTANYRSGAGGNGLDIWKFTADNNVTLISGATKAYGDKAIYNLDASTATLTGQGLRLDAPDQTIIARDKFEYFIDKGQLIATGAVKITQRTANGQTNTLTANKVTATLGNSPKGRTVKKVEALDNVVINTPTETLKGTYGLYNTSAGTAEIRGNVTIKRGPNTLEGARASVDLNTNISTLYGSNNNTENPAKNGRVRAVFYPSQ